jgi:hypothetical protein
LNLPRTNQTQASKQTKPNQVEPPKQHAERSTDQPTT